MKPEDMTYLIRKGLFSAIVFLIVLCLILIPLGTPKTFALGIEATPTEYETAKNFSEKFCSEIAKDASKQEAWNTASLLIFPIVLSPEYWRKVSTSDSESIDWGSSSVIEISSSRIVDSCGRKLSLYSEPGVEIMKKYLVTKFNDFNIQYRTAKRFSDRFCDAISDGLNQESAWKYSSTTISRIILSPLFWKKVITSKNGSVDWGKNSIIKLSAPDIVETCGNKLSLSGDEGTVKMKFYLRSKLDELENNWNSRIKLKI